MYMYCTRMISFLVVIDRRSDKHADTGNFELAYKQVLFIIHGVLFFYCVVIFTCACTCTCRLYASVV